MADLDYVIAVGRLGLTVLDGVDPGEDPDVMWCDSGVVRFTPVNSYTKVAGASPIGWTGGNSAFDVPVDASGYLSLSGARRVGFPDFTSPKVNPQVADGKATHKVEFIGVKSGGTNVTFQPTTVRLAADTATPIETTEEATALGLTVGTMVCDLVKLLPVPTAGGTPIIVGPQGYSFAAVEVDGDSLIVTLNDPAGTELAPTPLPVTMIDNTALIQGTVTNDISDPSSDIGGALSAQIEDAVPALPSVGPSIPNTTDAPAFVRHASGLVNQSATGFPTIYWPSVIYVGDIAGALGDWYMYFSTDHDSGSTSAPFAGKGGIGMAYADDLLGPWTVHKSGGNPVIYQYTAVGNQTETPTAVRDDAGNVRIYFQQQGTGANQSTLATTFPSGRLDDSGKTEHGIVIQGNPNVAGDGQTTYTQVFRDGTMWVATHLFGGGNWSAGGVSRSYDGLHWVTDPHRIHDKITSPDPTRHAVTQTAVRFDWRGERWAIMATSVYGSGFQTGDRPWNQGKMLDNYRGIKGGEMPSAVALATGETESVSPTSIVSHGGKLYAFYRSNGAYGTIRVAIAEA